MMGSPVVTVALLLSCVFLLSQQARGAYIGQSSLSSSSAGGEKVGGGRNRGNGNGNGGVDSFRQPDLPALYSAPRSHQEQESQDNEVDQQSSTDRDQGAVGTTTEIYFDEREEGTSEDYQFTTGTTQNPRDFAQNSDQPSSSSSSSSADLAEVKSASTYTNQGRLGGGYADVGDAQRQNDNFHHNNDQQRQQTQYQRRPLDQQQIENHLYPQQATISSSSPLTGGSESSGEGLNQIPNSFYGPPTQSITNTSRSRQPETTTQGRQNNFNSSPVTGPASNTNVQQEGGLVFQQTQTRYLPPFLPHIQQQQQQQQPQPRYQQQQVQQNQESVYHVPIPIPPRMTIPPRDSVESSPLSQSPQQTIKSFPQQQQQQQTYQQPENNIYQQRQHQQQPQPKQQQNYDRPQPSLGQYLPPQNQPTTTEHTTNQNQVQQYQYHERQLPQVQQQQQQQQQQQPQEQFRYLPPAQQYQQQQQQQQQPNFDNGITHIETNSAFEIDEPHDDTIVDAELLLRVQKIIEEHERQQKEIQEKFRRENEATESFLQNNNNIHDPSYPTTNDYFGQQQQERAGNNDNNIQSSHGDFGRQIIPQNSASQSSLPQSQSGGVQYTSQQEQQSRDSLNSQYGVPSFHQQQQQQQFSGAEQFPQGSSSAGGPVDTGSSPSRHRFQPQLPIPQNPHEEQYQRQVYQDVTNSINNVQRHNEPSSQGQWSSLPSNAYRNVPTSRSNSSGSGSENENPRSITESSSTTTTTNRKPSHIEYQKAILSNHFVETQTEFPTARNGGSRSFGTPRHQEYLPPSTSSSSSLPSSSSSSSSASENPPFDSSRRESFTPQFTSVSYGSPSQLNSKINSNNFFRPDDNLVVAARNENHGSPSYPSFPNNELPNRQQQQAVQVMYDQNQHSSGVATPLTNQIVNPRPVYGLPSSEFEGRQQQQQSTDGNVIEQSRSQYNQPGLSQPISSNYNDNLIGNQGGGQQQQQTGGDRIAVYPSPSSLQSQDQLSQTYNSLASLYPTSFTSNGNSRTIVVHEVPYGSTQGVTNRALITPTDLSQSSPSPSSPPNSNNQFFSQNHQNNGFSLARDTSYPPPTPNPSNNDVNFHHFSTQSNNPISYHQQQQQQQQQQSPSHQESHGNSHHHQIPQFLSNPQQTQQGEGGSSSHLDPEPRHYIPVSTPTHVFYSAPSASPVSYDPHSLTSDSSSENQISTPQPIYGIPLAPALGPDSIVSTSSIDSPDSTILLSSSSPSSPHNPFPPAHQESSQHAEQQQPQQQQQKFVSNENNYLPPSTSSQPHHQEVSGALEGVDSGANSNFNHDQHYLHQIISAYNALAVQQQAAWNQQQEQQQQREDDVNNNSVVVSSFDQSRLPESAVLYGPPSSSSISSINERNDYFYPRRNRSVSRRRASSSSSKFSSKTPSSSSSSTVDDASATKSVKEADAQ